jgi:hypothetical protein
MTTVFVEVPPASTQILKNTQATLSVVFSSGYADAAVTATVTNPLGSVVSTGAATKDNGNTGRYTYVLPPQVDVASLTITWSGAFGGVTQSLQFYLDIVGAVLFTIADARAFGKTTDLSNATTYPDQMIADARARVTDLFRRYCGVSFIPRYDHWQFDGRFQEALYIPNAKRVSKLLSVTINGVALSAPDLALCVLQPSGILYRSASYYGFWSSWQRNSIDVEYEHGWQQPPPQISHEALVTVWAELTTSQLADRFLTFQNEFGITRMSTPDWSAGRPTGIPRVDAVLNAYCQCSPVEVS